MHFGEGVCADVSQQHRFSMYEFGSIVWRGYKCAAIEIVSDIDMVSY